MPAIETTDWLALRSHIDTLVTSPVMRIYEPGAIVIPAASASTAWDNGQSWSGDAPWEDDGNPLPQILLSDVTNAPDRRGIDPTLHVRSGMLMLTVRWPLARAVTHTQLKEVVGQIAAHFPADTCMTYGPSRLRVTSDASVVPAFVDGAYRVAVVRVPWSSM